MKRTNYCGPRPALDEGERAEIVHRAQRIIAEYPRLRGAQSTDVAARYSRLSYLARDYGINLRTLYRYMKAAA